MAVSRGRVVRRIGGGLARQAVGRPRCQAAAQAGIEQRRRQGRHTERCGGGEGQRGLVPRDARRPGRQGGAGGDQRPARRPGQADPAGRVGGAATVLAGTGAVASGRSERIDAQQHQRIERQYVHQHQILLEVAAGAAVIAEHRQQHQQEHRHRDREQHRRPLPGVALDPMVFERRAQPPLPPPVDEHAPARRGYVAAPKGIGVGRQRQAERQHHAAGQAGRRVGPAEQQQGDRLERQRIGRHRGQGQQAHAQVQPPGQRRGPGFGRRQGRQAEDLRHRADLPAVIPRGRAVIPCGRGGRGRRPSRRRVAAAPGGGEAGGRRVGRWRVGRRRCAMVCHVGPRSGGASARRSVRALSGSFSSGRPWRRCVGRPARGGAVGCVRAMPRS